MNRRAVSMALLAGSLVCLTCLTSELAHSETAPRRRLVPPGDEASNPELRALRHRAQEAVEQRNVRLLAELMSADFNYAFESMTPEAFVTLVKSWPSSTRDEFWTDLENAVRLPGAKDNAGKEEVFVVPYVTVALDCEPPCMATVGRNVALRAEPARTARVIGWLSHDIVSSDTPRIGTGSPGWSPVVTASGSRGWVQERYVRGADDTRLVFERIDGVWRLVAIATGD